MGETDLMHEEISPGLKHLSFFFLLLFALSALLFCLLLLTLLSAHKHHLQSHTAEKESPPLMATLGRLG